MSEISYKDMSKIVFEDGTDGNLILYKYLLSPEGRQNPYPLYHRLRKKARIRYLKDTSMLSNGFHLFTGYKESQTILKYESVMKGMEPAQWSEEEKQQMKIRINNNPILKSQQNWLVLTNPPRHTRMRRELMRAFTPKRVKMMESNIRKIAIELIENIPSGERFEFIGNIAYVLPVLVISDLLGVPMDDRDKFKEWATDLGKSIDTLNPSEEQLKKYNSTTVEMKKYLNGIIDQRMENPEDDLVTDLTMIMEEEKGITREEVLDNLIFLLLAGHETTMNLMGNGLYALLTHPDQLQLLREDRSLLKNAIEEMLRFDPPVQEISRRLYRDEEINGYTIEKGEVIRILTGAANRDPEVNPQPNKFDISREQINHLSFGQGIHYCLGAPLARLEASVVFDTLLNRWSEINLAEKPAYRDNFLLRGYESLMISTVK